MKTVSKAFLFLLFLICMTFSILPPAYAAMNDYCIVPPFVIAGVKPNLILMIDNSGSMFDLAYIDQGRYTGTCEGGATCSNTQSCPVGQACTKTYTRNPFYCYDKTYTSSNTYAGYFDGSAIYDYDSNDYFSTPASFPASCARGTVYSTPGALFMCIDTSTTPKEVTRFVAKGNYLNWLTASKFDIQKQILTGGKYDTATNNLISEGRGCVGRRFIKEPLIADYVEGGTNTGLGVTFAVKGPDHPYSETLVSPGGQSYIEIYAGDYTESNCQDAVEAIIAGNKNDTNAAIELCLNYDAHGQYCSLDMFTSCTRDEPDCLGVAGSGTCAVAPHDGRCALNSDGVCSITLPAGVCTANDGTSCSGHPKVCVGGGKAGASCNNKDDCKYSSCTVGKVGNICTASSDCNLKNCTAGLTGNSCIVSSECNTGQCSAPAAKVGNPCTVDTACDSGASTCSAGQVGKACITSKECNTNYAGVCQRPVTQQIKSTFGQSMNECQAYWDTGSLSGGNWLPMMKNASGCSQIYKDLYTCNGGSKDAKTCVDDTDCPGSTAVPKCANGPNAIRQGSPILVCGPGFVGYCAGSFDNWATTNWYGRDYPALGSSPDDCIKAKFEAYCGAAQVPPVIDPSDDPSTTEKFDNLPAIIGDMGIGSQLGTVVKTLTVRMHTATAPTGLIKDFEGLIHFGAMTFDFYGSATECPGNVSCTKICTTALSTCMVDADCPAGDTCVVAINQDGGHILDLSPIPGVPDPSHMEGYILGRCSTITTTTCAENTDCPAGQQCLYSVGTHSSGLINAIDNVFASTWTPFAEGFYNAIGYYSQRTDKRLNGTDFKTETENTAYKQPIQYKCQKNNVLLITDGMSTADLNPSVTSVASSYNDGDGQIDTTASATCPKFAGSRNLDDLAWLAKNRSIKDFTETPASTDPEKNSKTITTYSVFNGVPSTDLNECNPEKLLMETAENGCGTASGCYQRAENPAQLKEALRQAFLQISGKAASGTAASVLASGEGSGANLIQAIFYPSRTFGTDQLAWSGTLQNFWYYIDPLLNNSSIREDSASPGTLDLRNDYIVHFFFDTDKQTKVKLFADADGNGLADDSTTPVATKYVDETLDPANKVKYIWEAGTTLWATSPASRTIYTFDGTSRITLPNTIAAGSTLIDLMQATNADEATAIARYVKGWDLKVCSTNKNICSTVADCTIVGETCDAYRSRTVTIGGVTNVWKLGDIISSTPKLSSWIPVGTYQSMYNDSTYGPVGEIPNYSDPADTNYFITRSAYKNRGTVFVGANDGMLHAFKLGTVSLSDSKYVKAQVSGTDIGSELWTYIPKHALPYLKYTADPGYCHIYSVDLVPSIFDVSIGGFPATTKTADSWKTVLIGGMRFGGACADTATSYQVQTPASGKGYSSYFALDITDPANPQVLWEFSNETIAALYPGDLAVGGAGGLGFTTTGPALIRTGAKDKNGRWFVVFASGPTGPIDTKTHQFTGYSDQNLKFYIIDLKNGPVTDNIWRVDTGIQNAFAGSIQGSPIDLDQNNSSATGYYQDDAMYFGYTHAEENPLTDNTKWTKGGVIRLVTKEDSDPGNWVWSKVIENIGPVTASVSKLQNYKARYEALWLFFGTGRYYFKVADVIDDANSRRTLYGIKDPCFITDPSSTYYKKIDPTCTSTISGDGSIDDATSAGLSSPGNWKINLDMCTNLSGTVVDCADSTVLNRTERLVTSPVSSPIGAVFFTTVKPSADVCEFGGTSHLWGVKYSTGGSIPRGLLKGTALIQVSTGSIEEKELKSVFVEKVDSSTGEGRRTEGMAGQTNEGGALIPVPPKPTNKILHIRER